MKLQKGLNVGQFLGYKVGENSSGAYCSMTFMVDGRKQWNYVNEPPKDKVYKYGKEITDEAEIENNRKSIYRMIARPAMILFGEEKVQEAVRNIFNFKDYCLTLQSLTKEELDPVDNPDLDIFFQYQYKPKKGYDRTFLELPDSEDNGIWVAKHTGEFKKVYNKPYDNKTVNALEYTNEAGEAHPFRRSGWFIDSNYWNPQGVKIREESKVSKTTNREAFDATTTAAEPSGGDFDDDLPF